MPGLPNLTVSQDLLNQGQEARKGWDLAPSWPDPSEPVLVVTALSEEGHVRYTLPFSLTLFQQLDIYVKSF